MEDSYTHQKMLTYLGNKRKLIDHIDNIVHEIRRAHYDNAKIRSMDLFCGSGVVARALAKHSTHVCANDMEIYAFICMKACLETPKVEDQVRIVDYIRQANEMNTTRGIISENYAPLNTNDIQPGERCFFTRENAMRIDTVRAFIETLPEHLRPYILGPLLVKASIHTNTSGQFQAFHKKDGVGAWGGRYASGLSRIKGDIELEAPVWSPTPGKAFNLDALECLRQFPAGAFDVIYLDPPYNQRQYSYLYFLLNIIAENKMPSAITAGGATTILERNDSVYCRRSEVKNAFKQLIQLCLEKSRFVILSYSNEGLLGQSDFDDLLQDYRVERHAHEHARYNVRGDGTDVANGLTTDELLYVISI